MRLRSAMMVDGRSCYSDDEWSTLLRCRRHRSVGRIRWSSVLVQSGEQRHRNRWQSKEEVRTNEGGGDIGGEGLEQRGIKAAAAPGVHPPA